MIYRDGHLDRRRRIYSCGRGITRLLIGASGRAIALLLIAGSVGAADAPPSSAPAGTVVKNAAAGGSQDRTSKSPAEALFVEKCGMCHRQMGMGTVILARRMDPAVAMLEARKDLRSDFVIQAARGGIGNMPRVQRGEVSDAQLQTIARYLARSNP